METVSLESGDRRLVGDLFLPPTASESVPGLLFLHGRNSNRIGYTRRAAAASVALNAACLTIDLSGHGDSGADPERFTLDEHVADVLVAYDKLMHTERVDPLRIGVVGASYGGYLAGCAASWVLVRRLLLRAPALYADADNSVPMGALRTSAAADAERYFAGIRNSRAAVLVLQSELDTDITPDVIERYSVELPEASVSMIPGATHTLSQPEWDGWFIGAITSWFLPL